MALGLAGYEARAREAVQVFWESPERGAAGDALATLLHRLAVEESQSRQHNAETVRAEVQLRVELAQRDDQIVQLCADNARLAAELGAHRDGAAQQLGASVQVTHALEAQLAQERAASAEQGAALAQLRAAEAEQGATLAQLRAELARRDEELAQLQAVPVQTGELDLRALAAALREVRAEPRPWRQIEELIKTPQSTVRSWLSARPERRSASTMPH